MVIQWVKDDKLRVWGCNEKDNNFVKIIYEGRVEEGVEGKATSEMNH